MGDALAVRLRRAFYDLRTEYTGPARDAAAVGVGVLIGCTPFYGLHLLICWAVGSLLRFVGASALSTVSNYVGHCLSLYEGEVESIEV